MSENTRTCSTSMIPTSNHNSLRSYETPMQVVYPIILHQTTTQPRKPACRSVVYPINPTSNHNLKTLTFYISARYIDLIYLRSGIFDVG